MSNLDTNSLIPHKRKPRYEFVLENLDWEYAHADHWFRSIDMIMCEGDTLDELIRSACITLIDQDGGEAGFRDYGALSFKQIDALTVRLKEKIKQQGE